MKIQKTELVQKLNKIKGVVPKRPLYPILQGVLVKDGYLIANNLEMTVKAKLEGTEGETLIIPEQAFDLINNLPDGDVEILSDGKKITIKADRIKNKYPAMDPEQFPETSIPDGDGENIVVDSGELLESMKRVSYAIPLQSTNKLMSAMCLQAASGYLNFVGLDGHVMAWDRISYQGEFELLIPKSTTDRLYGIGLEGNVQIRYYKLNALFVTDEYEVYTRLIDGKYFKYQNMFSRMPLHTVINRKQLLDAMIRVKVCVEEKVPVLFEMSGNTLNVSIKDSNVDYHETIDTQETMEQDLTIGFNPRLVIDTMKAFDCENVQISFEGQKMPMIVETENSDFKALVLPVNLG